MQGAATLNLASKDTGGTALQKDRAFWSINFCQRDLQRSDHPMVGASLQQCSLRPRVNGWHLETIVRQGSRGRAPPGRALAHLIAGRGSKLEWTFFVCVTMFFVTC